MLQPPAVARVLKALIDLEEPQLVILGKQSTIADLGGYAAPVLMQSRHTGAILRSNYWKQRLTRVCRLWSV
jgi:hypothetical protein